MKKICFLLLICLSNYISSQTTFNNASKLPRGYKFSRIISLANGDIIQISNNKSRFCFQKLNSNLKKIKKTKISSKDLLPESLDLKGTIHIKDKYFLLFISTNEKEQVSAYYAVELNTNTLNFEGKIKQISPPYKIARGTINRSENNFRGYFDNVNSFYKDVYIDKISPDSSKYAIIFSVAEKDNSNSIKKFNELELFVTASEKFFISVFDTELNKLWSNEFVMSNKNDFLTFQDFSVSNKGEVIAVANAQVNSYRVLLFSKDSTKAKIKPFETESDKTITDAKILSFSSHNYKLFGAYTKNNIPKGFYIWEIDFSSDTKSQPLYLPFSTYGIADSIKILLPRGIYKCIDNSYRIVYEKYDGEGTSSSHSYALERETGIQTATGTAYPVKTERTYTNHFIKEDYGDVYIANIKSNGSIDWIKHLPKFQHKKRYAGENNTYVSIECGLSNDKLHIVYIDNEFNFGLNPYSWKNDFRLDRYATLADVEIDAKGTMQKHKISKVDDINFRFKSNLGINKNCIIFVRKKRLNATKFFFVK